MFSRSPTKTDLVHNAILGRCVGLSDMYILTIAQMDKVNCVYISLYCGLMVDLFGDTICHI